MTNFYMLVGLPGSGKSTIAKKMIEKNPNIKVFSSDSLRKELWGDENKQGDNSELFNELHTRIKDCLSLGNDCIYDATNISAKRRTAFLNNIKSIKNVNKVCIFALTSIEKCYKNNKKRERQVPEDVIKNMYLRFDIPQYREGWDKIVIKRQFDRVRDYLKDMDKYRKIPHDNPHHLLSIGDHMCACTNYLVKKYQTLLNIDTLEIIQMATFFHDIGKPFTKTFFDSKGNPSEVAHYYGHEHVSAYMYLFTCKASCLKDDYNLNKELLVADLIALHMRMFDIKKQKDLNNNKPEDKLIKLIGRGEYIMLEILNEADMACS